MELAVPLTHIIISCFASCSGIWPFVAHTPALLASLGGLLSCCLALVLHSGPWLLGVHTPASLALTGDPLSCGSALTSLLIFVDVVVVSVVPFFLGFHYL